MWRCAWSDGGNRLQLSAEEAVARCDQDTIGVVAVLDSTLTAPMRRWGSSVRPGRLCGRDGIEVPVLSTVPRGVVAPFLDPELRWDSRVASINASATTTGWSIRGRLVGWRDAAALAQDRIVGCVAFGISAVGSYVVPATGGVVDLAVANAFTALGALRFLVVAVLLLPEFATAPQDTPASHPLGRDGPELHPR